MARRYSKGASKDVERAMRKRKGGTLKRGKGGRRQGEKPQAGHRHRTFRSAQEGKEGTAQI
jgi:hypothetical protein